MTRAIAPLLVLLVVTPSVVLGQVGSDPAPAGASPDGVVIMADVGGGVAFAGGGPFSNGGAFETELGIGYELPVGLRPEFAFVVGLAPGSHVALRPGLHFALPDIPFYVRAALDFSTAGGPLDWRWLLAGGGTELRLTDVLSGFAEADLGIPLENNVPVGLLVRAGVSFRF